jgi:hypothetical protein
MLCSLIDESAARRVVCRYLPTPKNAPCADLLARWGFMVDLENPTRWTLDLATASVTPPRWIQLTRSE